MNQIRHLLREQRTDIASEFFVAPQRPYRTGAKTLTLAKCQFVNQTAQKNAVKQEKAFTMRTSLNTGPSLRRRSVTVLVNAKTLMSVLFCQDTGTLTVKLCEAIHG